MLDKIKNKIKQNNGRLQDLHQMQEDQLALQQLLKMFSDGVFLPLTTWSISPREVLHICNEIIIKNRRTIVEFGSGFSTICIAQLLKTQGKDAVFYTVEADLNWANELGKILDKMGLAAFVKIIHAPTAQIARQFAMETQQTWYDTQVLSDVLKTVSNIDLVIVDGPIGASTPFARYSSIPFLQDKLSEDYIVFLDDASREKEKQIGEQWTKILGCNLKNHKRYATLSKTKGHDTTPYGITFKI